MSYTRKIYNKGNSYSGEASGEDSSVRVDTHDTTKLNTSGNVYVTTWGESWEGDPTHAVASLRPDEARELAYGLLAAADFSQGLHTLAQLMGEGDHR